MTDDLPADNRPQIVGSEWRVVSVDLLGSASDSDSGLDAWWNITSTDGSIDEPIRARSRWDAKELCRQKWPGIRFSDHYSD